jgi:hypothetical protein
MSTSEKFRIYDELLETLRGFFLRPDLWVPLTPGAAEAFFTATIRALDIAANSDYKLWEAFVIFKSPNSLPGNLPPSSYMTVDELMIHFRDFYDQHICIKPKPSGHDAPASNIPVRQELEVIPADEPKQLKLGWVIREHIGPEVYLWDSDNQPWPHMLRKEGDLKEGDRICFDWEDKGWSYEVKRDEHDVLYGISHSGQISCALRFDVDDRHCWVAVGFINLRGVRRARKLQLESKDAET